VEAGIVEFSDELMAHVVLPDGQTVGEWAKPHLELAYRTGKMPPMLGYRGMPHDLTLDIQSALVLHSGFGMLYRKDLRQPRRGGCGAN
jgi:hypothetical protein